MAEAADAQFGLPPVPVEAVPERARSECISGSTRPVFWHEDKLWLIDQRKLPGSLECVTSTNVEEVADRIKKMVVRGAPAIGAAGAYGVAMGSRAAAAQAGATPASVAEAVAAAKVALDAARPTAVNLMWATDRMVKRAQAVASSAAAAAEVAAAMLQLAHDICAEDVEVNRTLAQHGARLLPEGARVIHHCNTGALATLDFGTALGVIYEAHKQGKLGMVWVDETRPRLQGSRLTAWELKQAGIPLRLMADSAAGLVLQRGMADAVVFGADRVAANGDTANKIGTYKLCLAAREHGVPCYACVPTSTIDLDTLTGADIPIEERGPAEVLSVQGRMTAPELDAAEVFNPAFDVTPAKCITGIITEEGVCYPPFAVTLRAAKLAAEAKLAAAQE